MQLYPKVISMDVLEDKIRAIHLSIRNSRDFELISNVYAEGVWKLHISNPSFFNYLLKRDKLVTLSVLMNYIFSGDIASLTELYDFCGENKISGKNNVVRLMDYMVHSGWVCLIKEKDRRRKTPVLTEKGRRGVDSFSLISINALSVYDPEISSKELLTDDFYGRFYANIANYISLKINSLYNDVELLEMQSKSSGLVFLIRILLDVRMGRMKIGEPIRSGFFKRFSGEIGISHSHSKNLLALLADGGLIEKKGMFYVIKDKLIESIEDTISLRLAIVYCFIRA
jgi:predicted transcriptional regulator